MKLLVFLHLIILLSSSSSFGAVSNRNLSVIIVPGPHTSPNQAEQLKNYFIRHLFLLQSRVILLSHKTTKSRIEEHLLEQTNEVILFFAGVNIVNGCILFHNECLSMKTIGKMLRDSRTGRKSLVVVESMSDGTPYITSTNIVPLLYIKTEAEKSCLGWMSAVNQLIEYKGTDHNLVYIKKALPDARLVWNDDNSPRLILKRVKIGITIGSPNKESYEAANLFKLAILSQKPKFVKKGEIMKTNGDINCSVMAGPSKTRISCQEGFNIIIDKSHPNKNRKEFFRKSIDTIFKDYRILNAKDFSNKNSVFTLNNRKIWLWSSISTASLSTTLGIAYYLKALNGLDKWENLQRQAHRGNSEARAKIPNIKDQVYLDETIAWIGVGVGATFTVASIAIIFWSKDNQKEQPQVSVTPNGFVFRF